MRSVRSLGAELLFGTVTRRLRSEWQGASFLSVGSRGGEATSRSGIHAQIWAQVARSQVAVQGH